MKKRKANLSKRLKEPKRSPPKRRRIFRVLAIIVLVILFLIILVLVYFLPMLSVDTKHA